MQIAPFQMQRLMKRGGNVVGFLEDYPTPSFSQAFFASLNQPQMEPIIMNEQSQIPNGRVSVNVRPGGQISVRFMAFGGGVQPRPMRIRMLPVQWSGMQPTARMFEQIPVSTTSSFLNLTNERPKLVHMGYSCDGNQYKWATYYLENNQAIPIQSVNTVTSCGREFTMEQQGQFSLTFRLRDILPTNMYKTEYVF